MTSFHQSNFHIFHSIERIGRGGGAGVAFEILPCFFFFFFFGRGGYRGVVAYESRDWCSKNKRRMI